MYVTLLCIYLLPVFSIYRFALFMNILWTFQNSISYRLGPMFRFLINQFAKWESILKQSYIRWKAVHKTITATTFLIIKYRSRSVGQTRKFLGAIWQHSCVVILPLSILIAANAKFVKQFAFQVSKDSNLQKKRFCWSTNGTRIFVFFVLVEYVFLK